MRIFLDGRYKFLKDLGSKPTMDTILKTLSALIPLFKKSMLFLWDLGVVAPTALEESGVFAHTSFLGDLSL